ncbi:unnamed protein product [Symbiodinium necroappetens]|uniref:Reverse transcriptase domain-containing protein n=1 Tax=Symbiodinium necroappetens TaxID=1628268 RepID=A0A813CLI7_9DINO|nr:unnamed protein product [Symbiodinium necroappetens]
MQTDHEGGSPQKRRAGEQQAPGLSLDAIREAIRGEVQAAVGGMRDDLRSFAGRVDRVESQVTQKMQQTINLLEDMTGKYNAHGEMLKQLQEANREVPPPRGEDLHQTLATVAKAITIPGGGADTFKESKQLVQHRKQAQQAPAGAEARQLWKSVSRLRKQEFRQWKQAQAERAAHLDWRALRSLQQTQTHRGWQLQLTDDPEWQTQLRKHMEGIFAKPIPPAAQARGAILRDALRRQCKHTPWTPFTVGELQHTSHKWARNRSTGPDGVSHEAAQHLLLDPAWGERVREVLNDMLYRGAIPGGIEQGITVLLPKIPKPLAWGDTRPITLSSTFLKWAAQLLLLRGSEQVRHGGKGRQGVELVAILRRVVQMAKDWGVKTWIVKLDIRKAFDSVWQHSLSELVAARVGGIPSPRFPAPPGRNHKPWEALLWLSLNVAVGDTLTPVPQSNGIRQGSPDSPDLFGAIVAKDLQAALQKAPPQPPDPQGGPPPPKAGGSFLDDTYLWSQNRQHLQSLLGFLEGELARDGLHIHPGKTAVCSQSTTDTFTIKGETVHSQPPDSTVAALGTPLTFGDQTAAIIAEMTRRGRAAFSKRKKTLTVRTSLKPRIIAHMSLVRGTALYAAETWPAHQHLLRAANTMQATHYREMMHLHRRATESWGEWHVRTLRTARVHMHREGMQRWSTFILQRIWTLWGHMAQGGEAVTDMLHWKDLRFWRAEQRKPARTRVRHAGRFNPGGDIERALETIAGTSWGEVAQQRNTWQALQQQFVERFDVPWATGRQGSIQDNLHPNTNATRANPRELRGE